jgi:hypothetical protein
MTPKSRRRAAPGLQYERTTIRIDNFSSNFRLVSPGASHWSKPCSCKSHDIYTIYSLMTTCVLQRSQRGQWKHKPYPFMLDVRLENAICAYASLLFRFAPVSLGNLFHSTLRIYIYIYEPTDTRLSWIAAAAFARTAYRAS